MIKAAIDDFRKPKERDGGSEQFSAQGKLGQHWSKCLDEKKRLDELSAQFMSEDAATPKTPRLHYKRISLKTQFQGDAFLIQPRWQRAYLAKQIVVKLEGWVNCSLKMASLFNPRRRQLRRPWGHSGKDCWMNEGVKIPYVEIDSQGGLDVLSVASKMKP